MGDEDRLAPWVLVAMLFAATLAGNWLWLKYDATPLGYEVPEHWLATRQAADDLRASDNPLRWAWRNRRMGHRPAGVHLSVALLVACAPGERWPVRIGTWLLGALTLLVLLLSCWRLAEAFAPGGGPIAAALVLLLPASWGFSRKLGVDLPQAALFSAIAAAMIIDPPWERRRSVVRLGLLAGLACLVKAQLALWVGALAIASALEDLPLHRAAKELAIFAGAAALGSAPFWLGSPAEMRELFDDVQWSAIGPHTEAGGLALEYYPHGIALWFGPVIGLLTLSGCLLWLRKGEWQGYRAGARTLLIGLLLGLLPWMLYRVRWVRYALPLMPPLIAIGAAGLTRIPTNARRAILSIAIAVAIVAEIAGSGGWAVPSALQPQPQVELCHRPTQIDWRAEVRKLSTQIKGKQHVVVGITAPRQWQPDHFTILEWALRTHLPPEAKIYRRSARRDPQDLEDFRKHRDAMTLIVRVLHEENPPPLHDTWRRGRANALPDFDSDINWRLQAEELREEEDW